jgi:hypothetical protein
MLVRFLVDYRCSFLDQFFYAALFSFWRIALNKDTSAVVTELFKESYDKIVLPTFVFAVPHSALHLRGAGIASVASMRKRLGTRANMIDVNFMLIDRD